MESVSVVNILLKKGLQKRMLLYVSSIIGGVILGPIFIIGGIMLGKEGKFSIILGIFLIVVLILQFIRIPKEKRYRNNILTAIYQKKGIESIYWFTFKVVGVGWARIAEIFLKPKHHVYIRHQDGSYIDVNLTSEECFALFCELIELFPRAKFYFPPQEEKKILEKLVTQDKTQLQSEKNVYKEVSKVFFGLLP